jgi:hypothetical protein
MAVKLSDRESKLETELVQRVRGYGGRAEKVTVIGARGFFDRLILMPGGRVIFVEVKRPQGGRVSAHQMLRASAYAALGAEVVLIRNSADIDQLIGPPKN